MNHLGIDVRTRDVKKLMAALRRLKTTHSVQDGGAYRMDASYSQVHIETKMGVEQLDDWLWRVKHGAEYVGVFVLTVGGAPENA